MEGFRKNVAFSRMDLPEFRSLYEGMRRWAIPELIPFVVDPEGRTVGAAFGYPDHGAAVRAMQGSTGWLARLRYLWERRKCDRFVFHTVTLLEEARGKGLVELVVRTMLDGGFRQGYRKAVGALAKEGPTIYDKTGDSSRVYSLYERGL